MKMKRILNTFLRVLLLVVFGAFAIASIDAIFEIKFEENVVPGLRIIRDSMLVLLGLVIGDAMR